MTALEIVCEGLADTHSPHFEDAMRPELQRRLADFTPQDWQGLHAAWPLRDTDWIARCADILSPARQGAPATTLLLRLATDGPPLLLPFLIEKLRAHQALGDAATEAVARRLGAAEAQADAHWLARCKALLHDDAERPLIAEATELAAFHRDSLAASAIAGCYRCLATFPVAEIDSYIDDGETALCPLCGTDAVLPEAAGFPLGRLQLQAIHEFWLL